MNSFAFVVAFAVVAVASAGNVILPAGHLVHGGQYLGARLLVPAGSGLEGQYVHDHTETLYDDGSYRPELSPVPLSASPLGLVPSGSGLEGVYVHDHTETLYDDGSYKPALSPLPLSASPYGLVPAGSGLEGQYVHDITEKFYDDGSYKPGLYHY